MTENTRRDGLVSIGELSRATGVPVRTLRFYCDNGVLESRRSGGGHRLFDSSTAVDQVLLVRRLRTLGLSLPAIIEVLTGTLSITDAITAERAALDTELGVLSWRRASLRAVEDAPPTERAARLELLAAVQDRHRAHESLVTFWRKLLAPLPSTTFDAFVEMNIPRLPADPTPHHIVAFAELTTHLTDPACTAAMSRQLWRTNPTRIHDKLALVVGVAEACAAVATLGAAPPHPGPELDRFIHAHATARRDHDTPSLRHQLLDNAPDNDPRIHRYWNLTTEITGTTTAGSALDWLDRALTQWADTDVHA
ncbi:MerR family transcriptional regulator [Nocardia sp. NPDC052112]|uniref:MerR family transcriptional regulator n=1 Tax=Nocardia sp. NPDC052112 TaxID=3155646 RepID=UPI003426EAF8